MSVLVTPGNLRSSLAVTRSLGRRGIAVTVGDEWQRNLAGASRYCQKAIRVPSPRTGGDAFVHAIREELDRGIYQVVIPTDDISLWLLAESGSRFEGLAALPFADLDAIRIAHDKGALIALAREKGIPIPKTVVIDDPANLSPAIQQVGFPAAVKPRFSKFRREGVWIEGGGTYYVHSLDELEAAVRRVHARVPFPLVQEYIPGEGRGVFLLMNRGKVRAAFGHRRIREKPPSGGVSVLSESIPLDKKLLEHSCNLLEGLKWHGVAMLEFKLDDRDGTARLLEINGRFWGSLQLAVDAGVDFPYLLYRLAIDEDVDPVFSYREGVRLRWWLGDVDRLFLRLRDEGRYGAFREFLASNGNMTKGEVFRWDDPRPAAEELLQYVGHVGKTAIGRLRGNYRHD